MTFARTPQTVIVISCKLGNLFEYVKNSPSSAPSRAMVFLHIMTTSGVTTLWYLFHEVKNTASLYSENNLRKKLKPSTFTKR